MVCRLYHHSRSSHRQYYRHWIGFIAKIHRFSRSGSTDLLRNNGTSRNQYPRFITAKRGYTLNQCCGFNSPKLPHFPHTSGQIHEVRISTFTHFTPLSTCYFNMTFSWRQACFIFYCHKDKLSKHKYVSNITKKHAHFSCTCANKTLSLHTYLNIVQ